MVRLCPDVLCALLCAALLAGCGGTIDRIDGLPQTRDTSGVPWPRLVDVPAPPAGLQVETGALALARLDRTRADVLTRVAEPGPERVALADLGDRVARIRRQASVEARRVDEAELAARADRLARVRAVPVTGLSAGELAMRAERIAAARTVVAGGVDAGGLQQRARRIAAARADGAGGTVAPDLVARAQRVAGARGLPASDVDREGLAARGARIAARTQASGTAPDVAPRPRRAITEPAAPAPRPKPVALPKDRGTPVISDAFRKRAEEARRRARERAAAGAAE